MAKRQQSEIIILCPKCFHFKPRTGHHVYPREFWGRQPNGPILYLCEDCHGGLERLIHFEGLEKEQILQMTLEWLQL